MVFSIKVIATALLTFETVSAGWGWSPPSPNDFLNNPATRNLQGSHPTQRPTATWGQAAPSIGTGYSAWDHMSPEMRARKLAEAERLREASMTSWNPSMGRSPNARELQQYVNGLTRARGITSDSGAVVLSGSSYGSHIPANMGSDNAIQKILASPHNRGEVKRNVRLWARLRIQEMNDAKDRYQDHRYGWGFDPLEYGVVGGNNYGKVSDSIAFNCVSTATIAQCTRGAMTFLTWELTKELLQRLVGVIPIIGGPLEVQLAISFEVQEEVEEKRRRENNWGSLRRMGEDENELAPVRFLKSLESLLLHQQAGELEAPKEE